MGHYTCSPRFTAAPFIDHSKLGWRWKVDWWSAFEHGTVAASLRSHDCDSGSWQLAHICDGCSIPQSRDRHLQASQLASDKKSDAALNACVWFVINNLGRAKVVIWAWYCDVSLNGMLLTDSCQSQWQLVSKDYFVFSCWSHCSHWIVWEKMWINWRI